MKINYCTTATFYEYTTKIISDGFSPGCQLIQGIALYHPVSDTTINITDNPYLNSILHVFQISLPHICTTLGLTMKECKYHSLPYIASSAHGSLFLDHNYRK